MIWLSIIWVLLLTDDFYLALINLNVMNQKSWLLYSIWLEFCFFEACIALSMCRFVHDWKCCEPFWVDNWTLQRHGNVVHIFFLSNTHLLILTYAMFFSVSFRNYDFFFFLFIFSNKLSCPFLQIVLDSDDPLFGGFSRIDHRAEYFSSVRHFPRDP